jgi:hypothetical protein
VCSAVQSVGRKVVALVEPTAHLMAASLALRWVVEMAAMMAELKVEWWVDQWVAELADSMAGSWAALMADEKVDRLAGL